MAAWKGMGATMPPEKLALSRLVSALYLAKQLGPGSFESWLHSVSHEAYANCAFRLMAEEGASHQRTERENTALLVAAMVVVTYWIDVFPGNFDPVRATVEHLLRCAGIKENAVVVPLVQACAREPVVVLTEQQRAWVRSVTTLEGLEQVLAKLDPAPCDPASPYVRVRIAPISRDHIAGVLRPLVTRLRRQLVTESYNPDDTKHFLELSQRARNWHA